MVEFDCTLGGGAIAPILGDGNVKLNVAGDVGLRNEEDECRLHGGVDLNDGLSGGIIPEVVAEKESQSMGAL